MANYDLYTAVCPAPAQSEAGFSLKVGARHGKWTEQNAAPGIHESSETTRSKRMPRYFVDVAAGQDFVADEEGSVLPDLQAGRCLAVRALYEVAGECGLDGDDRTFTAIVRDEDGETAYRACLTLTEDHQTGVC